MGKKSQNSLLLGFRGLILSNFVIIQRFKVDNFCKNWEAVKKAKKARKAVKKAKKAKKPKKARASKKSQKNIFWL